LANQNTQIVDRNPDCTYVNDKLEQHPMGVTSYRSWIKPANYDYWNPMIQHVQQLDNHNYVCTTWDVYMLLIDTIDDTYDYEMTWLTIITILLVWLDTTMVHHMISRFKAISTDIKIELSNN
jgi:hypothetical protein